MIDMYQEIINKTLIAAKNALASTSTGTGVDCKLYTGWAKITQDCSAASAGTTTAVLTIEDSADNSSWAAISAYNTPNGTATAFPTVTNSAASKVDRYIDLSAVRRYVRAVFTIASGSATYGISVTMTIQAKRLPGS